MGMTASEPKRTFADQPPKAECAQNIETLCQRTFTRILKARQGNSNDR